MRAELLQLAAELSARGEPFVFAIVVRREPASSAQPGNMAVVTKEGVVHGWLAGSCVQPTVEREARQVLAEGRPRLISLSPEPARDRRPGVVVHPMTCHSGGTVDIYLEPVRPAPRLLVFGAAPTAQALCALGKAMGYAIDVVDPDARRDVFPAADRVLPELPPGDPPTAPRTRAADVYAAVVTMGQRDDEALLAALSLEPAYLGVVASRRRYAELRDLVAGRTPPDGLARVRNPAGLDLGARLPEEIALSVLAEIVQLRRAAERQPVIAPPTPAAEETALDPICGMTVVVARARHTAEHAGRTWYFCNARCRERFLATPERWTSTAGASP
ncbi:XdhC family protein [Anaeromyxobacter oryzae]|uniref:Carbon monoxide dehydrogenase F protein n=1 Tax=Anaeromyxobacter oryzae TaxID=2918170 RepID=A0ABM7WTV8_9BACT|nr:XdhC family protein [Anaeromyxobacter oryzae]BDG02925.1 carbon monoxide dehydrogenase F protein [Anaeromyxobacter oryzae]